MPEVETQNLSEDERNTVQAVAAFHDDHHDQTTRLQHGIDRVTDVLGRPALLLAILGLVAGGTGWAMIEGGGVDGPAFAWLEFAATIAALVLAMLILVTQRRETQLADRRAKLTLELALLADRKNAKIISLLEELRRDAPDVTDRVDSESEAMGAPADLGSMAAAIDAEDDA